MLLPLQQLLKIFYFSLLFFNFIPFQVCGPAYSYPQGWDFQAAFERYPPLLCSAAAYDRDPVGGPCRWVG